MPCLWRMKKMGISVSFTFRCVFISVWASLELCTLYRTLLFLDHRVMTLTLCYDIHLKTVCASKSIQGLARIHRDLHFVLKSGTTTTVVRRETCVRFSFGPFDVMGMSFYLLSLSSLFMCPPFYTNPDTPFTVTTSTHSFIGQTHHHLVVSIGGMEC